MGTMLQNENINHLPDLINLTNPAIVRSIHKKYLEAGSNIISTNTFNSNNYKLKDYDLNSEKIIKKAIENAKSISKNNYVALDIGPIGKLIEPMGKMTFDESYKLFKEQVIVGEKYGVDLILFETFSDIYELKSAIIAAKENTNLPIFSTMTFSDDNRTFTGTDIKTMISVLEGLNVDALGINCSLGPDKMIKLVDDLVKYSSTPILIQSNAGIPDYIDGKTFFTTNAKDYAYYNKTLINKGVQIIGGCCGTTDKYIKELNSIISSSNFQKINNKNYTFVSSYSKTLIINDKLNIVGEKINPTGKKSLRNAILQENYDYIIDLALTQEHADILDINMGVPKINEEQLMVNSIRKIQSLSNIPLQIDSSNYSVIEKALRYYNGKAIINSVNGKQESMKNIFPIAKKYGALIICLTIDEGGIPDSVNKRLSIAEKIEKEAMKYGINRKNLIFDFLVLAVSAQQKELKDTINTLSIAKNYNYNTTLGISNVSFGLPKRNLLNRTFLAMMLQAGLNLPIINTSNEDIIDTINSYKVLSNIDKDSSEYLNYYSNIDKNIINDNLEYYIEKGLKEKTREKTKELLKEMSATNIIDNILIPTLNKIGENYEKEIIFLPQLIQSSETAKIVFNEIKKYYPNLSSSKKDKIILATVEGDIHDIGKNIVKAVLENYGYEILDLGKDVNTKTILDIIEKEKISIVGLSALMTTTLNNMEKTVIEIKKQFKHCKVIIGGAVVTKSFAYNIGADFYAKDPSDALKYLNSISK